MYCQPTLCCIVLLMVVSSLRAGGCTCNGGGAQMVPKPKVRALIRLIGRKSCLAALLIRLIGLLSNLITDMDGH